jgi:propanol-preferring alcohol dehydrogenase
MKAARLHKLNTPLEVDEIEIPVVRRGEVLIRIAGAGVCHSDIHVIKGLLPLPEGDERWALPLTLGHENVGYIEKLGPEAEGFKDGDAVAVWGGRGCGSCRICRSGDEQLCNIWHWLANGGYAEFMHIPSTRFLAKLDGLDPVEASALTDAGLTSYRAIKKILPYLYPGAYVVLIGIGGLGHLALQELMVMCPSTRIVAVDVSDSKLQMARDLGAVHVVDGRGNANEEIIKITGGEGAQAVVDIVGSNDSLQMAVEVIGGKGLIVIVGVAGGILPFSMFLGKPEVVVTTSAWGTYNELQEVLQLAREGKIKAKTQSFSLMQVNEAFALLEEGKIDGRAVIIP